LVWYIAAIAPAGPVVVVALCTETRALHAADATPVAAPKAIVLRIVNREVQVSEGSLVKIGGANVGGTEDRCGVIIVCGELVVVAVIYCAHAHPYRPHSLSIVLIKLGVTFGLISRVRPIHVGRGGPVR
jgi:hypothetical protein